MKPSEVIADARVVLNDPSTGTPRWSDPDLLRYYNNYRKALAMAKGELFNELSTITLVDGEVQSVSRQTTFGLVDILKNKADDSVRMIDRANLELQTRNWRKAPKAAMRVWARIASDPFRFLCFPPATAGDTAQALVVAIPQDIAIGAIGTDDLISDAYRASASTYVSGMALTINTNAADTAKGTALLSAAMSMAGVSSTGG